MNSPPQRPNDDARPKREQLDSTYLAATRTLFAVIRTGSVVAGGGTVVTKLLVEGWPPWVAVAISSGFVVLGYWMMWSALRRGRQLRTQLDITGKQALFPHWQFAVMTFALQALILAVVVLYLLRH